MTRVFKM